jgi:hypothetical protein
MKQIVGFFFLLSCQTLSLACPNCKDALGTEAAKSLAQGYYWSILVLLSLPFLLTGFIALKIVRAYRSKKGAHSLENERSEPN